MAILGRFGPVCGGSTRETDVRWAAVPVVEFDSVLVGLFGLMGVEGWCGFVGRRRLRVAFCRVSYEFLGCWNVLIVFVHKFMYEFLMKLYLWIDNEF